MRLSSIILAVLVSAPVSAAERDVPLDPHAQGPVRGPQTEIPRLDLNAPLSPAVNVAPALQTVAPEVRGDAQLPQAPVLPAAAIQAPSEAKLEPAALRQPEVPPTSFGAKVRAILSRLKNPFGTKTDDGPAPALSPAEEGYSRFKQVDFWGRTAEGTKAEIAKMRTLKSKAEAQAYVRGVGQEIVGRILEKHGTANLGFHYNLHGGTAEGYVKGGGIRATMGDIANNYSMHGDKNLKVYFFQSQKVQLYDVLNENNPALLLFPSRMGGVLNIFKLDAPELTQAMADGRIQKFGAISMDFHGMKGVPYSAYVAPPLEVFHGTAKKLGLKGKLSRDEETLAVMRYLEAAALAQEKFVP